ncbi:purine nucleoside phosphorylase [Escherichia coli]|uniref:nucleoside phosphorylase n=1 Tax=Escherichia coli TaxID=562 RepID=UPI000B94011C|nr:nucleoside phosphorylase [Escherichia coli]EFJ2723062.1 nucleoside phosphorylase [Escherichia coli]OYA81388.1 purine nucleoside phosphorylase [Escherichia coli]OYA97427.1 purine nucleoside phosphorylase [Escherichia coli]OYB04298.1 purine nucleoside phosphorylase [Escherichia coli]
MQKKPHMQLNSDDICSKAIIVGDPARVKRISLFLDDVVFLSNNRKFSSLRGKFKGNDILVLSTGIGAPSTCIAVEELINIGINEIIRVGSCGAMQDYIEIGDIIIASGAVRCDGVTVNYIPVNYPAVPSSDLFNKAKNLEPTAIYGIIGSHDGFYMDDNDAIESYWSKFGIVGADMETSTLFVIGTLRNVKTLSVLTNVVPYQGSLSIGVNNLTNSEEQIIAGEKNPLACA